MLCHYLRDCQWFLCGVQDMLWGQVVTNRYSVTPEVTIYTNVTCRTKQVSRQSHPQAHFGPLSLLLLVRIAGATETSASKPAIVAFSVEETICSPRRLHRLVPLGPQFRSSQ